MTVVAGDLHDHGPAGLDRFTPAPPDRSTFAVLGCRILVAAALGSVTFLSRPPSMYVVLLVMAGVFSVDVRNPFSLKNFAVVYVMLVFGVGGAVLHLTNPSIFGEIVAYLVAFVAAYTLASLRAKRNAGGDGDTQLSVHSPRGKGPLEHLRAYELTDPSGRPEPDVPGASIVEIRGDRVLPGARAPRSGAHLRRR